VTAYVLVHVITKLELGGAQLATLYQVRHSQFAKGPHHLVYGPGGLLDSTLAEADGAIVGWPVPALANPLRPWRDARAVAGITRALRRIAGAHPGRKLLVHTHSSKAGILGRIAAHHVGAACIVHSIHGFGHHRAMPRPLFAALWAAERLASGLTTGFTADAAANLKRAAVEGLLGNKPRCVVRCGIDLNTFTPGPASAALRKELRLVSGAPFVLTVACLKPQKDPLTWVRVAQRVLTRRPDAVFAMAGDGVLRPQVAAALSAAGIADQCHLLGWRHDIADLLRLADIVLHTSRWEGLPQVFAQAMAIGRPIVATAVDGAPEAIVAGVSGFLRPPGDAAGLATDTLRLLGDSDMSRRYGAAGRQHSAQFAQTQMVADLDAFYARMTR
jgi:glycosyltransferase involved in cell wall biosynthesis